MENDAARGSVVGCGAAGGGERRRFPTAGLRRRIEIRDRVCSHPGCRAPATRSELDHTRQYAHGGLTTEDNLAAACAHDHDLRDNGWRVIQTAPGHVTWISRTGHRYPVQPPPIIESLPEPFAPGGWAMPGRSGASGVGGLAAFGYGAGSITDPANDELPFLPTWIYEPAWWEEPLNEPVTADAVATASLDAVATASPAAAPAPAPEDDIPPF
ncbi:HNH endonuclease signature motif containing protein [Microtetraspora sp. NBRC 16547]|uniref:HNH endonuclease signature motif containing protein n=1 Tax=Microtetraspora sp. NBRC 16547 TaxID=3030993 RepID=UPI0025532520|nr:HNH endonuclease signature motif containing protein [Microtetraspora sp. NBRC 16547]